MRLINSYPILRFNSSNFPLLLIPLYWSRKHKISMHFLVQRISQRILVNLIVTNRSSLVLKFEIVANTDFFGHTFFSLPRPWYIPFLSLYNHIWCLNRGFLTRWIVSRGLCYLKTHIYPNLGQRPDFMPAITKIFTFYHAIILLTPYSNVWCLDWGFFTPWIVSRCHSYLKTHIYPNLGVAPRLYAPRLREFLRFHMQLYFWHTL